MHDKLDLVFKFMHQTVTLVNKLNPVVALNRYLLPLSVNLGEGATALSPFVGHETIAYEFLVAAFTIYEESVTQTHEQLTLLTTLINTLHIISNQGILGKENYDTLCTKA